MPDTEQQQKKRRIACRVVNGVKLRLFKEGYDDGTGKKPMVVDGDAVVVAGPSGHGAGVGAPSGFGGGYSITEVDDAFWTAWVAQNEGKNPLLDGGEIYDLDEAEAKAEEGKKAKSEEPTHDDDSDPAGHV